MVFCVQLGVFFFFFFQAEDGIRDAQESRGLGDVYKRQVVMDIELAFLHDGLPKNHLKTTYTKKTYPEPAVPLSLIHI